MTVERLLQEFEQPVTDRASGATYRVYLYGRERPGDTSQGWLVFEDLRDGRRMATGVETTQPNAEAIVYWATGLTDAYFDGALNRARSTAPSPDVAVRPAPEPLVGSGDAATHRRRLADVERAVLACFGRHQTTRLLTQTIFDELDHAHADVVRALKDLEKQGNFVVRRTENGNDFVFVTRDGAEMTGVAAEATP